MYRKIKASALSLSPPHPVLTEVLLLGLAVGSLVSAISSLSSTARSPCCNEAAREGRDCPKKAEHSLGPAGFLL